MLVNQTNYNISDYAITPMYSTTDDSIAVSENIDLSIGTLAELRSGDLEYTEESNKIIIPIEYAKLRVDDIDVINTFSTIKIFIYNQTNITDSDIEGGNNGELLQSLQATIINNNLILDGFDESDFTLKEDGSYIIKNLEKSVEIPSEISLDNFAIRFGSDMGNLTNGMSDDYELDLSATYKNTIKEEMLNNSKFNFEILENPTSKSSISYRITKANPSYTKADISLLSNQGTMLYTEKSINVSQNMNQIRQIDISTLSRGIYYLSITTNNKEKFTKKIIVR